MAATPLVQRTDKLLQIPEEVPGSCSCSYPANSEAQRLECYQELLTLFLKTLFSRVDNDFNFGLSTYTNRMAQEKQQENVGNKLILITSKSQLMHEDSCILSEQPRFQ